MNFRIFWISFSSSYFLIDFLTLRNELSNKCLFIDLESNTSVRVQMFYHTINTNFMKIWSYVFRFFSFQNIDNDTTNNISIRQIYGHGCFTLNSKLDLSKLVIMILSSLMPSRLILSCRTFSVAVAIMFWYLIGTQNLIGWRTEN